MNKSKILKKSLAMILAVLMIVAMIPLSASAASTVMPEDKTVLVSITATAGKLEGTGTAYTDTVPYYLAAGNEQLDFVFNASAKVHHIKYAIDKSDYTDATVTSNAVTLSGPSLAYSTTKKTIIFTARDEDDKAIGGTYTITLVQAEPSADVSLKEVTMVGPTVGGSATSLKGGVSGKTITITTPWGFTPVAATNTITATLNTPRYNGSGVVVPQTFNSSTLTDGKAELEIAIQNQRGETVPYTVKLQEETFVTGITVAGVSATPAKDSDGKVIYDTYDVVLPEGTDFSKDMVLGYTTKSGTLAKLSTVEWGPSGSTSAIPSNKKVTVAEYDSTNAANEMLLVFTSTATAGGNTKTIKLHVTSTKSNDADVKSFTAVDSPASTPDGYVEDGTISGDKMTVELRKDAALTAVDVEITVAKNATVTIGGTAKSSSTGVVSFAGLNLKDTAVTVQVTAPDGKTNKYYQLTATNAAGLDNFPKITALKLKIGDDEYSATVTQPANITSKGTIAFTGIKYSTDDDDIKTKANYSWAKSAHTTIDVTSDFVFGSDIYKDTNTISVHSDGTDVVTYNVTFKKADPKTGKTLDSFKLYEAATSDDIDAEKTYTAEIKNGKVTITLPYSYNGTANPATGASTPDLVAEFTVPEGATLYMNDIASGQTGNLKDATGFALVSGYQTKEEPAAGQPAYKAPMDAEHFVASQIKFTPANVKSLVVVDEKASVSLPGDDSLVIANLKNMQTYMSDVTAYEVVIKYADPETGSNLLTFSADEGKVAGKVTQNGVTGGALEITVPHKYATTSVPFFADFTASKYATVTARYGSGANDYKALPTDTATKTGGVDANGRLKVVTDGGDGWKLQVYDGSTYQDVTKIEVTNEKGNQTFEYTVTCKKADAETDALITSLKVNGKAGVINNTTKTVTVTLPYNTDLTHVTLDVVASKMATISGTPAVVDTVNRVNYYDLTEEFELTIGAEDGKTVNVYTVTVTAEEEALFPDVKKDDSWKSKAIYGAVEAGLINGKADGTYGPDENIRRQDFAVIIANMMGIDYDTYAGVNPFSDKGSYANANKAIAFCAENGYMSGSNGKFRPTDTITRQEAASVIARVLELTTESSTKYTDDAKIAKWAKSAVYQCREKSVMVGDGKTFRPTSTLTRAEAASVLLQANGLK